MAAKTILICKISCFLISFVNKYVSLYIFCKISYQVETYKDSSLKTNLTKDV